MVPHSPLEYAFECGGCWAETNEGSILGWPWTHSSFSFSYEKNYKSIITWWFQGQEEIRKETEKWQHTLVENTWDVIRHIGMAQGTNG